MPKRKSEDNLDYKKIRKKIRKLEKKLHRRRHRSRSSSFSESPDRQEQEHDSGNEFNEFAEKDICEMLDGSTDPGQEICVSSDAQVAAVHTEPEATTSATAAGTTAELTMTQATASHLPDITPEETDSAQLIPDSVLLDILGEDPTTSNSFGTEIHKDLAVRLEYVATHGLSKELRKELNEKFLLPSNCRLINAPALNAETKAAISDINVKRDKSIELRQKQMTAAISCLGQVINKLITNKNGDSDLTKTLMDTERILCDMQYNDSLLRRNFILSSLKKEMKDQLQNTRPDSLLFGQNLLETIKTAKAINRSGADLKNTLPKSPAINKKPPAATTSSKKNLNWKSPYVSRKQTTHPKTKGPPPNNRPLSSSKHSRQQPTHSRR